MKDTSARNERLVVGLMLIGGVALVIYSMVVSIMPG